MKTKFKNNTLKKFSFRNDRILNHSKGNVIDKPIILVVTTYPPRECGIATYSQDLIMALTSQFGPSFEFQVCALECDSVSYNYPEEVKYKLQSDVPEDYAIVANEINNNKNICLVVVQHEFGLFKLKVEQAFHAFLRTLKKTIAIVFHTALPNPNEEMKANVRTATLFAGGVIVMTKHAAEVLNKDYDVPAGKITVIPHGTHLVPHADKNELKQKYNLTGRKVLSTFGLLSSGKGIETTLNALPEIISKNPEVVFLIIGKTHSGVVNSEGESYRDSLKKLVRKNKIKKNVVFINKYLSLNDLLEYLQLTDIYLFTSRDPNQTVSGTFSYAMSCGCPIISTPIPHAKELLDEKTGIFIDFQASDQLAKAVNRLLSDEELMLTLRNNGLERIASTAWENSAIEHAKLFKTMTSNKIILQYTMPDINLDHFKKLTTKFGMLQFSKINQPDPESGYTLDDNARAMIGMCMEYELTRNKTSLLAIHKYLKFIAFCQHADGTFSNYVDIDHEFTAQNKETNLSDSNGRAIWALGYLISKKDILPLELSDLANSLISRALKSIQYMHSPRAMAFTIKGFHLSNLKKKSHETRYHITLLADRLVQQFRHESEAEWLWFENCLTYANSVLPEALLYAWKETGDDTYKEIAKQSFDFLLSHTFPDSRIKVISNKSWFHKGQTPETFGEQAIDVAYTILALDCFYGVFGDISYLEKSRIAFSWFLGNNHLSQIIYNPCTGGCYDGLEEKHVNLNQGAESTISYLLARLTIEKQEKTGLQQSDKEIQQLTILPLEVNVGA